MWIPYDHEAVRLSGRWGVCDGCAVTTAPGSVLEAGFTGELALLHFDTALNAFPMPHVWICVDDGAWTEAPLDRFLRVRTRGNGPHKVTVICKSAMEMQHRWRHPLVAKVAFRGMDAEGCAALPPDDRRIIEFIGDSITEGVLVDEDCRQMPDTWPEEQYNRPCQDDATATYAWLTAEALGMRPVIMGYGAVGVTKGGCGGVVAAPDAYPFCFENTPYTGPEADVVVVNHGANDRGSDAETYVREYRRLLDAIQKRNPRAVIVILSAFCGVFPAALRGLAESWRTESGMCVHFIDTAGWIPPEPLHPGRGGHAAVAEHLIPRMREILGL